MKLEAEKGDSIYRAAQKAIELAKKSNQEVVLVFNEAQIYVSQYSYDQDIATIYFLKRQVRK